MPELTEFEQDLRVLEIALRDLETSYNMYFAGQEPKPPLEKRRRVESLLRRFDRAFIQSAVDRFRLGTLQSRFSTFAELWDRALRAREEGRPGPFFKGARPVGVAGPAGPSEPSAPPPPAEQVVGSVTVSDVTHDVDKIEVLYQSLIAARTAVGTEEPFPFHRFAQIVKGQFTKLQQAGSREVSFRISVKDGKVAFTARGVRTAEDNPEE